MPRQHRVANVVFDNPARVRTCDVDRLDSLHVIVLATTWSRQKGMVSEATSPLTPPLPPPPPPPTSPASLNPDPGPLGTSLKSMFSKSQTNSMSLPAPSRTLSCLINMRLSLRMSSV